MATEIKKVFKDDKEYHDKQEKIFEAIDKYDLEGKLSEYFIEHDKHKIAEVNKHKKRGGERGRFAGLGWRELEFKEFKEDKEEYKKLKPYTGVQIYLYSINENEIGNISDEEFNHNRKNMSDEINEFPYDYNEHYLLGKDLQIDTNTGNLIKKDNSFTKAQIWFCIDNDKDNCILGENNRNEYICGLKNELKDVKIKDNLECRIEITKKYIGKYFKELKDQRLVSDEIELSGDWDNDKENNCKKFKEEIEKLLQDRIKYLEEQSSE